MFGSRQGTHYPEETGILSSRAYHQKQYIFLQIAHHICHDSSELVN